MTAMCIFAQGLTLYHFLPRYNSSNIIRCIIIKSLNHASIYNQSCDVVMRVILGIQLIGFTQQILGPLATRPQLLAARQISLQTSILDLPLSNYHISRTTSFFLGGRGGGGGGGGGGGFRSTALNFGHFMYKVFQILFYIGYT